MALSEKCCLLSTSPRGAAYWRRSSCSRPGRGSRYGACWSCTAAASFMWASGTRSSRYRSRDAATTRAESESVNKENTINLNGSCQRQMCKQSFQAVFCFLFHKMVFIWEYQAWAKTLNPANQLCLIHWRCLWMSSDCLPSWLTHAQNHVLSASCSIPKLNQIFWVSVCLLGCHISE